MRLEGASNTNVHFLSTSVKMTEIEPRNLPTLRRGANLGHSALLLVLEVAGLPALGLPYDSFGVPGRRMDEPLSVQVLCTARLAFVHRLLPEWLWVFAGFTP